MSHEIERTAIVAEALSWIGTPFRHAAGIKGVGADCVHFVLRTFQKTGHAPADFAPPKYAREWHIHRSEELILKTLPVYARQIEEKDAGPGDVVLYRIGRTASHLAIIVDENCIAHAYSPQKMVGLHERRSPLRGFIDSYWTVLK
jgi:NlpC/P60 family putative phage cell wall peptidase